MAVWDKINTFIRTKEELEDELEGYSLQRKNFFYIGVASQNGDSTASLKARGYSRTHHIDKKMCRSPDVILHTQIIVQTEVCAIENALVDLYKDSHQRCLNGIHGNDSCIVAEKGIVYVRIYLD
jgi:hypothetical protein